MFDKLQKFFVPIVFASLLFIPIIIGGKYYFVGGDDLKLYYLFPEKYLENYVYNVISDNTLAGAKTGYYPVSEFSSFLYLILILKKIVPFINTQYLLYGINYASGFLFFYLLLGFWNSRKDNLTKLINVTASLFYVLSPFLFSTIYNHKLLPFYLIAVFPATLYLIIKGIREKNFFMIVVSALACSVFGMVLNNMPWVVSFLICSVPIFSLFVINHPRRFILSSILFVVIYSVLNLHSIYHLVNSQIFVKGLAGTLEFYSSKEFKEENVRGIIGVSTAFSPLSQPLLVFDNPNFQKINISTFKNLIFIGTILSAGVFFNKLKQKRTKSIFLISLTCLIISWFCFSPNFGNWGPNLFVGIMSKLPFMTMFRNMFDKFAIPLSFYYALSFGLSLGIIKTRFKNNQLVYAVTLLCLALVIYNGRGIFKSHQIHAGNKATITGEFNEDFNELLTYFKNLKNESTIMWIPLTAPNYLSIEDQYLPDHFYSGLSPLRILAGKTDYAGRFGFIVQVDLFKGDKLLDHLKQQDYIKFGNEIQKLNVRYIVVDNQSLPESMQPFLYDSDKKYLKLQNEEFKKTILGEKINDFGNRYSLYEINESFVNDKIYFGDEFYFFSQSFDSLKYEKIRSSVYKIHLSDLSSEKNLVFLDPYYKEWTLFASSNNVKVPYLKDENKIVFDYANGWVLKPDHIKKNLDKSLYTTNQDGSINISFELQFEPDNISPKLKFASTLAYFFVFLLALYLILDKLRVKKSI